MAYLITHYHIVTYLLRYYRAFVKLKNAPYKCSDTVGQLSVAVSGWQNDCRLRLNSVTDNLCNPYFSSWHIFSLKLYLLAISVPWQFLQTRYCWLGVWMSTLFACGCSIVCLRLCPDFRLNIYDLLCTARSPRNLWAIESVSEYDWVSQWGELVIEWMTRWANEWMIEWVYE